MVVDSEVNISWLDMQVKHLTPGPRAVPLFLPVKHNANPITGGGMEWHGRNALLIPTTMFLVAGSAVELSPTRRSGEICRRSIDHTPINWESQTVRDYYHPYHWVSGVDVPRLRKRQVFSSGRFAQCVRDYAEGHMLCARPLYHVYKTSSDGDPRFSSVGPS